MDKVFHSFIIIIIIVRFLFRRNIYIYISILPPFLLQLFQPTTSRDVSLDLHPPVPLPPGYLSWKRVLSRFIDLLLLRRFRNVSVRIRRGTVVQQLDSHPPNLSTNITTDITTVHSPHDIHPRHTIYRPALLNGREKRGGGEDGGGGLQPRLIKFWTRIAALRPNFEKRHGVNWKLVSLPIHGGVPWYRKKLPSTLLLPPSFFSRLEREDRLECNQSRYTFWFVWSSIARSTRLKSNLELFRDRYLLFVLSILRRKG